jgi:sec-independent protein translocase protein TatA
MPITIASIMNFMGPDLMVILLIVLLLFGAKKLPELARGMGRAVKEFNAARDEVEGELSQSGSNGVAPSKLDTKGELPTAVVLGSSTQFSTILNAPSLQNQLDDRSHNS